MSDTHFGFTTVDEQAKADRVRGVFDSVAPKYDVMNDLMSLGLHRLWKAYAVGVARVRPGDVVLDIAGGTGDPARAASSSTATSTNRCCARVAIACSTKASSCRRCFATPSRSPSRPDRSTSSASPSACAT